MTALGIGMTSERTRMRMIEQLRKAGIEDERVLAAMAEIPRHQFIDEGRAVRQGSVPDGVHRTVQVSATE
jgi:protein-L-isoaspartate(D-aspartate) O-methyltransferase